MIIRVSELQPEGLTFRDPRELSASPFADREWRLETLSLQVEPDGVDVLVHGDIGATMPQTCGRCLEPFRTTVHPHLDLRVTPRPAPEHDAIELGADDLDTDFYANDELDLGALIQNETMLALPMKPLCRADCRGLCPVCGGNRNLVACACQERQPDSRWAALNQLSTRLKQDRNVSEKSRSATGSPGRSERGGA